MRITRRQAMSAGASGLVGATAAAALPVGAASIERPNILWLVSEDNAPFLGAYGDRLAHTPNIDALARKGVLYRNAFAAAPICAPSRFGILTGVHPEACAPANHMRANATLPSVLRTYPEYLRSAGYYCTNNAKTDYNCNVEPARIWDESSGEAHYRNRPAGAPFMAVFNHAVSHESRLFGPTPGRVKPADVRLPAYVPDAPEVRVDYASYYNLIERMDGQIGDKLAELDAAGLAENTIVFYYSDHGGVLPRSKRYCYDEGLRCALVVYLPPKWAHLSPLKAGSEAQSPVTLIDLAPTLLSLAGIAPPATMQGSPFLGRHAGAPKRYAFGMRNRMNDSQDFVRTVTDGRYRYIRNYMPHRPAGQHQGFSWLLKSYQAWDRLYRAGGLPPVQRRFFEPRVHEEFYDLQADRDQVNNLIGHHGQARRIATLRRALDAHMIAINDNGFIPEGGDAEGYLPSRAPGAYPLKALMALGSAAARGDPRKLTLLRSRLGNPNAAVRYWAATGLLILGDRAEPALAELERAMRGDASVHVRVVAAEAVARAGRAHEAVSVLATLIARDQPLPIRLQAMNALTYVPDASGALPAVKAVAEEGQGDLVAAAKYLTMLIEGTFDPAIPLIDVTRAPPGALG